MNEPLKLSLSPRPRHSGGPLTPVAGSRPEPAGQTSVVRPHRTVFGSVHHRIHGPSAPPRTARLGKSTDSLVRFHRTIFGGSGSQRRVFESVTSRLFGQVTSSGSSRSSGVQWQPAALTPLCPVDELARCPRGAAARVSTSQPGSPRTAAGEHVSSSNRPFPLTPQSSPSGEVGRY